MDYTNLKDQELVDLFISSNDNDCIIELIRRYKSKVYTYILLNVKERELAEDIFQETFIKVIKSLRKGRYMEKGIFLSWVVRISHNLIIDHYRRDRHLKITSTDQNDADLFNSKKYADRNIEDLMVQNRIEFEVRQLINELPKDQKEVILLRHYGEMSFKEIADQTGVSINTALGRMRYALINLRKMIEDRNLQLYA
ncbi:MAG: sigma-70 family RNA polymerase sigma factor [Bacteroidales bacterium]|jgi:RNA polymerase sigma-70 factor (ECF subfamily)|nr:sigma-70 family RNA polymerase sigma factor [Bacteroidales bacterium]MBR6279058.1 sigma-70 family RNA polymerase sigma factor [Bacteroidales bacterium]